MNSEKIGTWLGIVSNLGVLVGLLLLALEIRDSNRQASIVAAQETILAFNESAQALVLSSELPEILIKVMNEGFDSLTEAEKFRVRGWELARLSRMNLQYIQYQEGYLDQRLYEEMMSTASELIDFWQEIGVGLERYEFLDELIQ